MRRKKARPFSRMKAAVNTDGLDEQSLVQLYMNLTGARESVARSVFMHVCGRHEALLAAEGKGVAVAPLLEEPPPSLVLSDSFDATWMGKAIASPLPG